MGPTATQIAYALFVWWFSTGLCIWLNNLPRSTHRWSMLGATVLLAVSLHGLGGLRDDTSLSGAYWGFTYGVLIWAWHELSFFMGFVTGPLRTACPPTLRGWARFGHGVRVCLHHELAILATAAAVAALSWHAANQVGLWTFTVLWLMRQSAKLNIFLGVRNLNAEFVPEHLAFIRSLLRRRPMNPLFPFSVTLPAVLAVLLAQGAGRAGPFVAAGIVFANTMLVLGIIEHWLMVLPLPFAALWRWFLRARAPAAVTAVPEWLTALPPFSAGPLNRLGGPAQPTPSLGGDR